MASSQAKGLLEDEESASAGGWEEGQILTVRCMLGRGPDAVAVRAGIAKTGLRLEETKYSEEAVRNPGPQLAVVDLSIQNGPTALLQLSQRTPKCWTMALAADASTEAEALCAGAEVVLRSPADSEVVALWLERLRERIFQMDSTRHALERATAMARAEAIGQLVSAVIREVHRPLFMADLDVRCLRKALTAPELDRQELTELATDLFDAVEHMHRITVEARSFATAEDRALEPVHLPELVREAVASTPNPRKVPVEIEVVTDERAWAHREPLEKVLDRILEHAMDAASGVERPRVHVRIYRHAGEPRVSIRDNGPSVGPECQHGLFQPFFRPKDGCAHRIGLAPCREYVARMGGALTLAPCEGGSIFRIRLQSG